MLPLRKFGPLVEKSNWSPSAKQNSPDALRSLSQIIDQGLCHRCGSCVGICPTETLGLDKEGYPVVENLDACTNCNLCVKVCPGNEFIAHKHAQQLFDSQPDIRDMHGCFISAHLGYAIDTNLRQNSTSGGVITALLISLLESGTIDGALVVVSDKNEPWKGCPIIARNKKELLASTKSKYAIAPTNVMLKEIRSTLGRYAVVGLPCQIHGIRKAAKLDRRVRERIVLTVGLFCHAAVEHDPMRYIWNNIPTPKERIKRFISRIGKHPGTPHVELDDGTLIPVYFPTAKGFRPSSMEILNILYRLYTPPRCLTCYDSTSEFADISVGDPWMIPPSEEIDFQDGYSFVLVRSTAGKELYRCAIESGHLSSVSLNSNHARTSNRTMGIEKRARAFRIIDIRKRKNLPIPNYGFDIPKSSGMQSLLTEINIFTHIFCFLKHGRKLILWLTFSPIGYGILWLNNKRRQFQHWVKNKYQNRRP